MPSRGRGVPAHWAPDGGPSVFLTREELAAFRSKPDPKVEPKPGAPADGLVLENASDRLLYFVLDGVAVAAVPSQSSRTLVGVPRGRYEGEWRTLLGDQVEAPAEIEAPSVRSTIRAPSQADAGPP